MAGYQEVLTDPSYRRQIVDDDRPARRQLRPATTPTWSPDAHPGRRVRGPRGGAAARRTWRSQRDLGDALADAGVVGIEGIDTRRLTRHLRDRGAMRAGLSTEVLDVDALRRPASSTAPAMVGAELASEVTTPEPYVLAGGGGAARSASSRSTSG